MVEGRPSPSITPGSPAGSEESGETVGAEVGEAEGIGVDADGPNVRGQ